MDYRDCLEIAGATVHAYERFGSYQGDWFAWVTHNGRTGLVWGSYGSCSGCDEIEGNIEYDMPDQQAREIAKRIGENHLNEFSDVQEAIKRFTSQSEWDGDAIDAVKWLSENCGVK